MFGRMHLAPAVTAFLKQFPRTRVEMLLLDRVVGLVEEGIDVGIRIGALSDSSLVAIPVGHVRRVVCASPALLKRVGTPAHPKDLSKLDCIGFTGLAPGPAWPFFEKDRPISVQAKTVLTCNQAYASMDACAAGLGFGVFLSYMIRPLERENKLKVVLAGFRAAAAAGQHRVSARTAALDARARVRRLAREEAAARARRLNARLHSAAGTSFGMCREQFHSHADSVKTIACSTAAP